jgi:F-type H+-transporting ATPase subunit b
MCLVHRFKVIAIAFLSMFLLTAKLSVAQESAPAEASETKVAESGHADHEPHDPTHDFAGAMQSNPMEWRADGAIFSLIVFLLLLGVLRVFAWKPISEGLEKREQSIATQIAEAKQASETAAAKLKEYEAKLADAAVKSQELVAQARKDAELVADRIKAEAQAEATRSKDRALAEIETAKNAALSELTSKSTDMAFVLARKVVGRELKAEDHQRLITDAIGGFSSTN